jgi:hypothetical protein
MATRYLASHEIGRIIEEHFKSPEDFLCIIWDVADDGTFLGASVRGDITDPAPATLPDKEKET